MNYEWIQNAEKYTKRYRRNKRWQNVVRVLSCIVVFCTTYALILPAITLDESPSCGLAEHQHDFTCYLAAEETDGEPVLLCEKTEHLHSDACFVTSTDENTVRVLTAWEQEKVDSVITLIDAMPDADAIYDALAAYEDAEDYAGEEAYLTEVYAQIGDTYTVYRELGEVLQGYVTNADKLLALDFIWSRVTLIDEIDSATPTTVSSVSTRDFIELNLYDYGSNINTMYKSNNKYPGFQWNGGAYFSGTYDRHAVDYIDFGNSLITDFTYGSYSTANGQSTNKQSIGNQGGAINALDVNNTYGVTNRPIGMSLNSSISSTDKDVLSRTLGSDGYPALKDNSSLSYLFKSGTYATKKNTVSIDGLFQQDSVSGEYYYNSRTNHAQYSNNRFTLYKQIVTSNFLVYPFGNFLPFNDITNGSNATQVSRIKNIDDYIQGIINDLVYAGDYSSNTTKQQLVDMLARYRTDLKTVSTSGGTAWTTWNAANAINDYFKGDDSDSDNPSDKVTFSMSSSLLKNLYNIDYDVKKNFFFGMEMKMNFLMPKDGMTGNDNGNNQNPIDASTNMRAGEPDGISDYPMEFYFTGDDDVWVYVDDVLFLDLSGIHRHVGGKIDFVNGKVTYYYLDIENGGDVSEDTAYKTYTFKEILNAAGKDTSVLNAKGTFQDYTTHSFKFYYMERGSGSSVCRMNFNFPLLQQNTISVEKELSADDETKAVLGNADYSFLVLVADASVSGEDKTVDTDKDGKPDLFIAANEPYTLYDTDGSVLQKVEVVKNKDGTVKEKIVTDASGNRITDAAKIYKTDSNGVLTLKAGQKAEFVGISENAGTYLVRELFDAITLPQYGEISISGSSVTVDSDNPKITIGNTVFTGVDSHVTDVSDGSTAFHFNNKITTAKLGKLTIGKRLEPLSADNEDDRWFVFNITIDDAFVPAGTAYTVTDENGTTLRTDTVTHVTENGVTYSRIQLRKGETATIANILAGSRFTVQETSASAEGYTVTYAGADGSDVTTNGTVASGVIQAETAVGVTVTNTEKGTSIPITGTKTVENPDGTEHTFRFQLVEVTSPTDMTVITDRIAEPMIAAANAGSAPGSFGFTLYYAQRQIASYPAVYYYKITEESSSDFRDNPMTYIVAVTVTKPDGADDITASVTDIWRDGVLLSDGEKEIAFTNTLVDALKISKTVEGGTNAAEQRFAFTITLQEGQASLCDSYPAAHTGDASVTELVFTDGAATVWLGDGESVVISDLPVGTKWTVTEETAGYRAEITGAETVNGSLAAGTVVNGENSVSYTNYMQYELPATGGSGTYRYIFGGLLCMAAAWIYSIYIRRKDFTV